MHWNIKVNVLTKILCIRNPFLSILPEIYFYIGHNDFFGSSLAVNSNESVYSCAPKRLAKHYRDHIGGTFKDFRDNTGTILILYHIVFGI